MTDKDALRTPGEVLAAAREQQSLSVAQVAEKTKIPPAMIEAVEADEYHKISGPIYVRSFLRTIAQAVGVDTEQVLGLYAGMAGREGGPGADKTPVWDADEVVVQHLGFSWRPWMIYAAAAVVAVLALGLGVRGCGHGRGGRDTGPQVSAAVPDVSTAPADSQVNAPDTSPLGVAAAATRVPCPDVGAAVDFGAAGAKKLVLRVESERVVSLRVRTDGQREFASADWSAGPQGIPALPAGEVVPGRVYRCGGRFIVYWNAADHFGLKVGDPTGVTVRLQGRPYSLEGLAAGQEIILDRHSLGL